MPMSKITTKGQATIPKSIRNILNVRPLDRIVFHVDRGRVWIEGRKKNDGSLFGKYQHKARRGVTVEKMNKAIIKRAGK